MKENVNEAVNSTNNSPMDAWFKESMDAFDKMMKSAEKIIEKEREKNDEVS